jgi:hypothetical protein
VIPTFRRAWDGNNDRMFPAISIVITFGTHDIFCHLFGEKLEE